MLVLTRGAGRRIRRAGWSSRRKRGGAGVGRRRPSTKNSVRSGAEDGEGGVDGAPDSKVKSWRRLAESDVRAPGGAGSLLRLRERGRRGYGFGVAALVE